MVVGRPELRQVGAVASKLRFKVFGVDDFVQRLELSRLYMDNLAHRRQLLLEIRELVSQLSQSTYHDDPVDQERQILYKHIFQPKQQMFDEKLRTRIVRQIEHQIDSFLVYRHTCHIAHDQDQKPQKRAELVNLTAPYFRMRLDVNIGALVATLAVDIDVAAADETQRFLAKFCIPDFLNTGQILLNSLNEGKSYKNGFVVVESYSVSESQGISISPPDRELELLAVCLNLLDEGHLIAGAGDFIGVEDHALLGFILVEHHLSRDFKGEDVLRRTE